MCEVLEHISDDRGTLEKLGRLVERGGRLVLSTPTSSYGMLPGDTLSATEGGGHVRPGYDGPELDEMLRAAGFVTIRRILNGGVGARVQHLIERRLCSYGHVGLGRSFGFLNRPLMPMLDAWPIHAFVQITIATKMSA